MQRLLKSGTVGAVLPDAGTLVSWFVGRSASDLNKGFLERQPDEAKLKFVAIGSKLV